MKKRKTIPARVSAWPSEKDGSPGYMVRHPWRAISWSPKDEFEAAYFPLNPMSFAHASDTMMLGERIWRTGWDGEGMWGIRVFGSGRTDEFVYEQIVA